MPLAEISFYPSDAWEKKIPRNCVVDRDDMIVSLCKGKSVMHLGAADSPFHKEKASSGELLHQKIRNVASHVVGIDSDEAAVTWLREKHKINDILVADATTKSSIARNRSYEIVLCCDVIEHVSNISGLLDVCKSYMYPDTVLVITTINGTALKPALRAVLHREAVHHEHICYFSYSTICQLLLRNELVPIRFGTFSYSATTLAARVFFGIFARFAPATADGIIVAAKLRS